MGFFTNLFRGITGRNRRESSAERRLGKYTAQARTAPSVRSSLQTISDMGSDTDVEDRVYELSDVESFLYLGDWLETPSSSNVSRMKYDYDTKVLSVAFHGGRNSDAYYDYYNVDESEARMIYERARGSAGGAVWDYLRVRGTQCGHQKEYTFLPGPSSYHPKWHCSNKASKPRKRRR